MMTTRNTIIVRRRANIALPSFPIILALTHIAINSNNNDNNGCFCLGDGSWIDPDTPDNVRTVKGYMGNRSLDLVFSDEFEDDGRMFGDGMDSRWTAEDKPGTTNAALQYYNSSTVLTKDGKLVIQTSAEKSYWTENDKNGKEYEFSRDYKSGLLSGWNKFCFTSGVIEISLQLPGRPHQGGAWPAFWMMGNLARMSYLDSSDGVWPWSWDKCGNSDEAKDMLQGQKYDKCGRRRKHGRGSPEIDIVEAMPGTFVLEYEEVDHINGTTFQQNVGRPMISASLQVAPGIDPKHRPETPDFPKQNMWYQELYPMGGKAYADSPDGIPNLNTIINNHWYGQIIKESPEVWQDGLSVNIQHSPKFYEEQVILRTEWQAPMPGNHDDGYIKWYFEDELVYEITAQTLKNRPGATDTIPQIPYEAMYMILNTDVSPKWGWNGCNPYDTCSIENPGFCSPSAELTCTDCSNPECLKCIHQTKWLGEFCVDLDKTQPMEYLIDYVRIYQDKTDPTHSVSCDPPNLPTKDIINENWDKYTFNPYTKKEPLQHIQLGEGSCFTDEHCGGNKGHGECDPTRRKCICTKDWTGPHCLTPHIGDYAICGELASNFHDQCHLRGKRRLCTEQHTSASCQDVHTKMFNRLCEAHTMSCDMVQERYENCSAFDKADYMLGYVMRDMGTCCDDDALNDQPCGTTMGSLSTTSGAGASARGGTAFLRHATTGTMVALLTFAFPMVFF